MTGGSDAYFNRMERNARLVKAGKCTFCPPHRKENRGGEDGKIIGGVFRPSKGKARK